MIQKVRAAGGFLIHLKHEGSNVSLCGHEPRDSLLSKMNRARWMTNKLYGSRPCERCHEAQSR